MKHFKVVGPETTREFDIEDDEMIVWKAIKIKDYEDKLDVFPKEYPIKNEKIYPTKPEDLSQ